MIYEITDKEFKMPVIKDVQSIREMMREQHENTNKETKYFKGTNFVREEQ